jgi:hypothetical protein
MFSSFIGFASYGAEVSRCIKIKEWILFPAFLFREYENAIFNNIPAINELIMETITIKNETFIHFSASYYFYLLSSLQVRNPAFIFYYVL